MYVMIALCLAYKIKKAHGSVGLLGWVNGVRTFALTVTGLFNSQIKCIFGGRTPDYFTESSF